MEIRCDPSQGFSQALLDRQAWLLENYRIRLVSCVLWRSESPWDVPPRCMIDDFIMLPENSILAGAGEEAARVTKPGELFMVPAGRRHWYGMAPGSDSSSHIMLHMLTDSQLCLNPLKLLSSHFHVLKSYGVWYERLKWLAALQLRSPRAASAAGASLLSELLLEIISSEEIFLPSNCQDERIRRALDLAEERCLDGLSVPEMARAADLGEVQFRKLFLKQTGLSPKRHLEELRMRKACEALRSGPVTRIRALAHELGFRGEWHFCASFKRFTGMTPSEFRRQSK